MKAFVNGLAGILVCGFLFSGYSANAMAEMKIAVVDIQAAVMATKEGKKIKKELEADRDKRKAELEKKAAAIDKMQADFEKKSLVLSDDARAKKQQQIDEQKMQYMQLRDKDLKDLAEKGQELSQPVLKKLGKVIDKIAKKDGYIAIFHKNDQNLVWASQKIDITDKVIKALEKSE